MRAASGDVARASAYASIDGADASVLHLILLNKHASDAIAAKVEISGASYARGHVWGFDAASARITARPPVAAIGGSSFDYPLPPLTALHLVLRK